MLTAELVHARRQRDRLYVVALGPRTERAMELAEELVTLVEAHVGMRREELDAAIDAIEVTPRDRKLRDGLAKLIDDRLEFDVGVTIDPIELRGAVFTRAALARRDATTADAFDRASVLAEVAQSLGIEADAVEAALFGDLKSAKVLRPAAPGQALIPGGARGIVERYDLAQAQAVLLRATLVRVHFERVDPVALRVLFRKLKFLRLLFVVERSSTGEASEGATEKVSGKSASRRTKTLASGPLTLTLDGPFSLFESTTKYGLALALSLPALAACGPHRLEADVKWGKEGLPLRFELERSASTSDEPEPQLPEEAELVLQKLGAKKSARYRARIAEVVHEVRGVGVVVPDLELERIRDGAIVHVEFLGYWSRDAVFRRVELAVEGLATPMLFCLSDRLRVSESVLPSELPHGLFVYRGAVSITALEDALDAVLARAAARNPAGS